METCTAKEIAEMTGKTERAIRMRATKEGWPYIEEDGRGRGGKIKKYIIHRLPADIQTVIIEKKGVSPTLLPVLAPEAALKAIEHRLPIPTITDLMTGGGDGEAWTPDTAISEADLKDPRIRNILAILREADAIPRTWTKGKRKWIESVAIRHNADFRSIYRWRSKYEKRGIAGLRHSKSTAGKPKSWTPEAVDFWIGLCLKPQHRKINRKDLYNDVLLIEAHRRGWNVGCYNSANWWYSQRSNPQLEALQRGGLRALDNILPPILRDYSDLEPFEILVGDQHRFNRWVVDDETGEVFRQEGYLWQDLRTRIIYGAALDKKYDAWLIGLALRIGMRCFGAFGSIYTDNGRPECSRYLTGILANMRSLGMEWRMTDDVIMEVLDVEAEDIDPHVIVPGSHRKAVVKNAKAKMIEGTFDVLESVMTSHLRLPGHTKRLSDDIHWQDVDQQEAEALAKAGKLLLASEHALLLYLAIDYYNREKAHRGVLREWAWKPKPKTATPYDCLKACFEEGWRPRMVSREAADLIFLARKSPVVQLGRITLLNDHYEHDDLIPFHKQRVDIRYNPMALDEVHVFKGDQYICTAYPIERSSMKDMSLAQRKIEEKRARRKRFSEEFKRVTSLVPDFREYSKVPEVERVAALIGDERRKKAEENKEANRVLTQEELDRDIARLEAGLSMPPKSRKPLPERPEYFMDRRSRYEWAIKFVAAGGTLDAEDAAFQADYESAMSEEEREYWHLTQQYGIQG